MAFPICPVVVSNKAKGVGNRGLWKKHEKLKKNGRISMKISENRSILGQDLSKLVVDYQNLHPGGLKSKISCCFSGFFKHFFHDFLEYMII